MYAHSARTERSVAAAVAALAVVMSGQRAQAQPGTVQSHQKISDTQGSFTGILDDDDRFGGSLAWLGDLDGDGVGDLAVGAYRDDDGSKNHGAVWILFLNPDGTVKSHQKISDTEGGFKGILDDEDNFGFRMASLGDLDGDGPSVLALAVGAQGDDDGDFNHGAVWILFLNVDTTGRDPIVTVKSHHKISDTSGDLPPGALDFADNFGTAVASLADLDGDGVADLAVGAWHDDDGGTDRGAVWILFLNADGTVNSHQKISSTAGGGPPLNNGDDFGNGVDSLGDLDGDGVGDLAVGAVDDDDGGTNRGAVWILFLNTNGTVKSHQKISDTQGGFTGILDNGDQFGTSVASLADLDDDGVGDLAVGAYRDDDGDTNRGAVWILFLNTNGTVKSHKKISDTQGGFTGTLDDGDFFGTSVAALGDLDRDGVGDLAVGAYLDDDGGPGRGAVWVLFLDGICLWDLDANGNVGASDLLALLASWGPCKGCPADFDDNGFVGASDLLALLASWGQCPEKPDPCGPNSGSCFSANGTPGCSNEECCNAVCEIDPLCCDVEWDEACAAAAVELCPGCGNPNAGDCFEANGTPFCDDAECCELVCELDPVCCELNWDSNCADLAKIICSP